MDAVDQEHNVEEDEGLEKERFHAEFGLPYSSDARCEMILSRLPVDQFCPCFLQAILNANIQTLGDVLGFLKSRSYHEKFMRKMA